MPEIVAVESAVIPAPPHVVYGILADYRHSHPRILPPKYFGELVVEAGGVGDGTRIRFDMRSFGSMRTFQANISEPEPGRRLVERVVDPSLVTTFTVEAVASKVDQARVTIDTRYVRGGIRGWAERLLAPAFLRSVYRQELAKLAEEARTQSRSFP